MERLEGVSGNALTSAPPHTAEGRLAVVVSHPSSRSERHLTTVLARLDGILIRQGRSRLWFVAETLAIWAERAEARVHAAEE
jgi:hypothetical protein